MSLVYFIAGFLACILCFLPPMAAKKIKSRPWSAIRNLRFEWSFDYRFEHNLAVEHMVESLSELMKAEMKKERSEQLKQIVIQPGQYSVRMNVDCAFVRRDSADA